MLLPDRTTVLIVGAGPTGLVAAHTLLLHHGFHNFIIVDAVTQGKNSSRAIVAHAATLEALDTIGCGDDIISQGTKSTTFSISTRSTKLISPHIESLKSYTQRPYTLIIPQNLVEHVLEKKLADLGVTIHRPVKVVGLRRNVSSPQLSDVTFEDGRMITTKYVIGADGARSVVRAMASIGFFDPTAVGEKAANHPQSVVADISFDTTQIDESTSGIVLSPNSCFLWVPLPSTYNQSLADNDQITISERIYRIGCNMPLTDGEISHAPTKECLQSLVDRFGPYCLSSDPAVNPNSKPTRTKEIVWSSRFCTRAAIADTTFTRLRAGESGHGGVILLLGDAAHIHSPIGGHGMNLGLRDAVFLGEALIKHMRAAEMKPLHKADQILREFAALRHARALETIGLTKRLLSVLDMKYRERVVWWCPIDSETVRAWVLWILGCCPFACRRMALGMSELSRR